MTINLRTKVPMHAAQVSSDPGTKVGALMRREGVYSSSLSTWRRQREATDLVALAPQKRGPKADPARIDAQHIAQLTRERDPLRVELDKAQLVIEVQKKLPHCSICWRPRTSAATPDGRRVGTHPGTSPNSRGRPSGHASTCT